MGIFNKPLSKKVLTPEASGTLLMDCAKVEMSADNIASITNAPQTAHSIRSLIFLTKAAIIISCLRREAGDGAANCRPYLVADAFEKHLFSEVPPQEQAQLAECIKGLLSLTKELDDSLRKIEKDHLRAGVPRWCRTWLSTISDDEDFLTRTSLVFGGALSIYVHGQISSLEKSVRSVLYEKK